VKRFSAGLAVIMACALAFPARADDLQILKVKTDFDTLKQDVADAIVDRGYVIDHTSLIGKMLDRTGGDVGSTRKLYSDAETVQFCSAVLSRTMMEADPSNIALCPFVIFYYERADQPGVVYVGYRELEERGSESSEAAIKAINRLLREIIEDVAGG
jgi:uncharacterized protein (DUF302 family)